MRLFADNFLGTNIVHWFCYHTVFRQINPKKKQKRKLFSLPGFMFMFSSSQMVNLRYSFYKCHQTYTAEPEYTLRSETPTTNNH